MDELDALQLAAPAPTVWGRLRGAVMRFLGVGLPAYAGSGGGIPVHPAYDVQRSLSAMSANPWMRVGGQAITTDLSGVPLVATKGRDQLEQHWLLDLLKRPNPKTTGRRYRRQLYIDFTFPRNAYTRVWWREERGVRRPYQLARIHPNAITPIVSDDAEIVRGRLPRLDQTLAWDEVLHVADVSIADDPSAVLGTSIVEPLALGLQVDSDTRKQAGRAARRGRLEMMLAPRDDMGALNSLAVKALVKEYGEMLAAGHGVYVVSRAVNATPMSLTARDGEFTEIRHDTRDEALAVLGVPEVRAGKPSANYGTAVQQMRTHWEARQHEAALFDDEWSRLSDDGVQIAHSFKAVQALQSSRTEQYARAGMLIAAGASPREAFRYEGYPDAPVPDQAPGKVGGPDVPEAEMPREPKAAVGFALREIGASYYALGHSGEIPEWCQTLAARRLQAVGVDEHRAAEAAELCHLAAREHLARSGPEGIMMLRAFGPEHAQRIAA